MIYGILVRNHLQQKYQQLLVLGMINRDTDISISQHPNYSHGNTKQQTVRKGCIGKPRNKFEKTLKPAVFNIFAPSKNFKAGSKREISLL